MVNQTLVFQIKFCGKNPALRVAANRYQKLKNNIHDNQIIYCLFLMTFCYGQNFEGKLTFSNSYIPKDGITSAENLSKLLGKTHIYKVKDGNYRMTSDGTLLEWQNFIAEENELSTKLAAGPKPATINLNKDFEKVKSIEVVRNAIKILDRMCDEFTVYTKTAKHKFYIESSLSLNPEIFKEKKFSPRFAFFSKNHILALKMIVEDGIGVGESTITNISEEKLNETFFAD